MKPSNSKPKKQPKKTRTKEFFMVFGDKKPKKFPTSDHDDERHPYIIYSGRFEMNKRRH